MSTENHSTEASRNQDNSNNVPFYRIVLTGGPCGGKTTALARVSSYLRERGFDVIMVPEAFTILYQNGMSLDYFGTEGMDIVIQNTVMNVQKSLEDGLENVLKARGKPGVLICDRGMMDGAAYMPRDEFEDILAEQDMEVTDVREGRYNAVFHMVTAADGASQFYSLENNDARSESPEEAIAMDKKTQGAWAGHPRLFVLDNSTGFEGKLQRLVEATAKLVGLPTNLSRSSAKFLLKGPADLSKFTVEYQNCAVEKVYLIKQDLGDSVSNITFTDEYTFIRKRTTVGPDGKTHGGSVYGVTTVQKTEDGKVLEKKRIISSREYAASFKQRDMERHIVQQQRISFLYNHQSFVIHVSKEFVVRI